MRNNYTKRLEFQNPTKATLISHDLYSILSVDFVYVLCTDLVNDDIMLILYSLCVLLRLYCHICVSCPKSSTF